MSTKTITLLEEAYERLKSLKTEHDSFSDVVLRLTKRKPLTAYVGLLTKDEAKKVEHIVKKGRQRSKARAKKIKQALQ